ncbi:MAG: TonB-dependent receptor, partial [Sphingobacteriales bacterium]
MINTVLKSIFRIAILCLIPFFAAAQQPEKYAITGLVVDSVSHKPVDYSTITILNDKGLGVSSGYTTESGAYKIMLDNTGTYKVIVTYIGYATYETSIVLTADKKQVQVKTIYLQPASGNLQEVTITATKNLVEQKPGMLVYNAENDITNKGGSAADVLRKAPVINVDAQGNVTMRGSGNLKILVNGKYSGQMARSPADALNMMPASNIKSVEIITTPSAKYDAEGAAGVINIITKKNSKNISGTLEAGISNMEQVLNPRFTFSNDKWSVTANAHLHRLRRKSAWQMTRVTKPGDSLRIVQELTQDNYAPHGSSDINIDYSIDTLSQLTFGINTWFGNWPDDNVLKNKLTDQDGNLIDQYSRDTKTKAAYLGNDFSIGYNKKFKTPGQEITLLAQFSPSKDNSNYKTVQYSINNIADYNELNNSHTVNREWTLQADYIQPLGAKHKYTLEGGLKMIRRSVKNAYDVASGTGNSWDGLVPQPDRSDIFRYKQDVYAGYALAKANLGSGWYAEAGTRIEGTYLEGKQAIAGTNFSRRFTNFVPTATLSKKLGDKQTFN